MRRLVLLVVLGLVAVACSPSSDEAADTTGDAPTTTPAAETTTTAPAEPTTTTTVPATTTTEAPAEATTVEATPIVGVLEPYGPGGEELFEPGTVEAHWYQWNGLFVVLYRGFDPAGTICAGNSILVPNVGFSNITNSPHNGIGDEICIGTAAFAEAPSGVRACDTLLYYVTAITTDLVGDLFGTLEINDGSGWIGQTSTATSDLANTPAFEPDQAAYELPPSDVDAGGLVVCDV